MFSKTFISATKEFATFERHIPAPLMRKSFYLDSKPDNAKITICGLGFYQLYINGHNITKGLLAPYISNPDELLYYDEYDLLPYITQGENVVGIILGNGNLNCIGGAVWDLDTAVYRSAPKVAFEILLITNGEKVVINADESVKTHPSAIEFDDLRCGEIYDARNEVMNWNQPGFDDSEWIPAIIAETPRGETVKCEVEPIVVTKELKPVSIYKSHITHLSIPRENLPRIPLDEEYEGYLYDFGVNAAGNVKLKISGKTGQKIVMQFGELLADDGGLDLRGMSFQPHAYNHRNVYILKGDTEEIYIPYFSYQGFRYCLVKGLTEEQATEDLLTYYVMNSDLSQNGDFSCSDELLNKLQKATVVSDLSNFYYFPTDCPHREKNGWTADAALSAEQMLFNLTPEKSLKEWLRSFRTVQNKEGALPGIIPTSGWGFEWGNGPGWDSALIYLPYYIWLYRGDEKVIKDNAHAMLSYLDYISNQRDDKGLIHIGLGDWLHIGRGENYKTPLFITDTLICMNICNMCETMFNAIGYKLQAEFASNLYNLFRSAARKHIIEADGVTVISRTQTGQALGIRYGLFDKCELANAFKVFIDIIKDCNYKMDCGVLGAREIFHVLADFGYADLAYKMIIGPDYPSYGHWIIKENATSLFESFQSETELPISKNHHFFGDISSWFFKHITGVKINPHKNNCNEVEISPNFIKCIKNATGWINLKCGKLSVDWRLLDNNDVEFQLEIPEGCTGIFKLPRGYEFNDECRKNYIDLATISGKQVSLSANSLF